MTALQQALLFVAILAGILLAGFVVYSLSPVLAPFLIAFFLAYITDPLVEFITTKKIKVPRTLAVTLVFLLLLVIVAIVVLLVVPLISRQINLLIVKMPVLIDWLQLKADWIFSKLDIDPKSLDLKSTSKALAGHFSEATEIVKWLWQAIFKSGFALVGWLLNIGIIFIVFFYLLRDWHRVNNSIISLIPVKFKFLVLKFCSHLDSVFSTFIRGQLTVMIALGTVYSIGLSLCGVHFSILLGIVAGLLSIVPYLGTITGLVSSLLVAYIQFQSIIPLLWVALVFIIGNVLESFVLTPVLIGDKLGLHPVAVIFAVLAGGQLLGFTGVMVALPVTAFLVVLFREILVKVTGEDELVITAKT